MNDFNLINYMNLSRCPSGRLILIRPPSILNQQVRTTLWTDTQYFMRVNDLNVDFVLKHHSGVIRWKHFPRYRPFVRGIHRSPANSPHKGQWRGSLIFSLICAWINRWVNNRVTGDLRRHRAHYDVIVMNILGEFGRYNMTAGDMAV